MWLSVNFENSNIAQRFDGYWLAMICDWCVREEHSMVRKKRNDDRETSCDKINKMFMIQ